MAFLRVLLFVLVSCLGYSYCAFVDNLKPCPLKDKQCQIATMQNAITALSETGAPEYEIPPIDPIHIKNLDGSIFNVLELVFVEGTVKGVKNCVINDLNVEMERLHASIELTCDITIKGKYSVKSTTDAFQALFGGKAYGEGNGKIKIEQIKIKIEFPYKVVKRGDDFFFTSELKKYKYSFKVLKRVTFHADKLYVAGKESSKDIVKLVNENWNVIVDAFGSHFMDLAVEYMYPFILNFFKNIPAKAYITDDLSSYVK